MMLSVSTLLLLSTLLVCVECRYRNVTGWGTNPIYPERGAALRSYVRSVPVGYVDGLRTIDPTLPNARVVSNAFAEYYLTNSTARVGERPVTEWATYFGQFFVHDISGLQDAGGEAAPVKAPQCDRYFDPNCLNNSYVHFGRSRDASAGTGLFTILNNVTPTLDLSVVYGSSEQVAMALREGTGGLLKMTPDNFLPNANQVQDVFYVNPFQRPQDLVFVAGDYRAMLHPPLTTLHTAFAREHNRLAREFAAAHPSWDDETLYQEARRINIGQYQAIFNNEYVATIVGERLPPSEDGFDAELPGDADLFLQAVAFRYGHTEAHGMLPLLNEDFEDDGTLSLRDCYFDPRVLRRIGFEGLIRGLSLSRQAHVDMSYSEDIRSFLIGIPGAGGMDLLVTDIMRGRDSGMPSFSAVSETFGFGPITEWSELTDVPELVALLEELYGSPDRVEALVGILLEEHLPGSNVGRVGKEALLTLWAQLRDSDALWYEHSGVFTDEEVERLDSTTLSQIFVRNFDVGSLPPSALLMAEELAGPSGVDFLSCDPSTYSQRVELLGGHYMLEWLFSDDGSTIEVAMTSSEVGWVGVGFRSEGGSGMVGADIYVGAVVNGQPVVSDRTGESEGAPTNDVDLGGSSSILALGGFERDGHTTVCFRRPTATDHSSDVAVNPGFTPLIVAFGESDELSKHLAGHRAAVEVDLLNGGLLSSYRARLRIVHIVFMGVAWLGIFPLGFYTVRYGHVGGARSTRVGFHVGAQVFGVTLTLLGVVAIFVAKGSEGPAGIHAWVGILAIFPTLLVQASIRVWPCLDYLDRIKIHRLLGPLLLFIGQFQAIMGLARLGAPNYVYLIIVAYQLIVVCVFLVYERRRWEYVGEGRGLKVSPEPMIDSFGEVPNSSRRSESSWSGRTKTSAGAGINPAASKCRSLPAVDDTPTPASLDFFVAKEKQEGAKYAAKSVEFDESDSSAVEVVRVV